MDRKSIQIQIIKITTMELKSGNKLFTVYLHGKYKIVQLPTATAACLTNGTTDLKTAKRELAGLEQAHKNGSGMSNVIPYVPAQLSDKESLQKEIKKLK